MTNTHPINTSTPEVIAYDALVGLLHNESDSRRKWLVFGAALNEMKAQYPGDNNAFGAAVKAAKLDKWPSKGGSTKLVEHIQSNTRLAAMWAAALPPDELAALEAQHPNTEVTVKSGFRGLHAAVMRAEKRAQGEKRLADVVECGREGLMQIQRGGEVIRTRWLDTGHALTDMKVEHNGDMVSFAAAVNAAGLNAEMAKRSPCDGSEPIHPSLVAAMWAYSLPPDELAALQAKYPNVEITSDSGFRDLHAVVLGLIDPAEFDYEDDEEDHVDVCTLIEKRVVELLSGEFEVEYDEKGSAIDVIINGTKYEIAVTELNEDGSAIYR